MTLLEKVVRGIDRVSEWTAAGLMWLTSAMVLITAYNVFERYFLHHNTSSLIELNWHFYSLIYLLGAAYTFKHDGHVRVDLVYHRLSPRAKTWVNLFGTVFFMLPVCFVIVYVSLHHRLGFNFSFVGRSWHTLERSPDPGGLPARYLLKAALPLGFFMLAVQGIAEIIRNVLQLKGRVPFPREYS